MALWQIFSPIICSVYVWSSYIYNTFFGNRKYQHCLYMHCGVFLCGSKVLSLALKYPCFPTVLFITLHKVVLPMESEGKMLNWDPLLWKLLSNNFLLYSLLVVRGAALLLKPNSEQAKEENTRIILLSCRMCLYHVGMCTCETEHPSLSSAKRSYLKDWH